MSLEQAFFAARDFCSKGNAHEAIRQLEGVIAKCRQEKKIFMQAEATRHMGDSYGQLREVSPRQSAVILVFSSFSPVPVPEGPLLL